MYSESNNGPYNRNEIYRNKKTIQNSTIIAILGAIIAALSGILIIYSTIIVEKANQNCNTWSCGTAGESTKIALIVLIFILGAYELIRKQGGWGLVILSVFATLYSTDFFLEVMLRQSRNYFAGIIGTIMFVVLVSNTSVLIMAKISKR